MAELPQNTKLFKVKVAKLYYQDVFVIAENEDRASYLVMIDKGLLSGKPKYEQDLNDDWWSVEEVTPGTVLDVGLEHDLDGNND